MQLLTSIRDSTNTVTDISFFIKLDRSEIQYTEQEIAQIVNGKNYKKSVQQLDDFIGRCNKTLGEMQQTVEQKNGEYNSLLSQCRSNQPGSAPSSWVDRKDPDAVARYNEKVNEFNNKLAFYESLQNKASNAKEKVEAAQEKLDNKKQDFEEQIEKKKETLKPALDQDIVAFLAELQKLVQDNIRNKRYVFQPFILIFMAKKAYMFFFDMLDNSSDKNSANSIFRTLDDDLEKLIENHQTEIQQGLADVVDYLNDSYVDNKVLLEEIKDQMSLLPYQECRENEEKALELVSRSADTNFSYEHIIDPRELSVVEIDVKERKSKFQYNIQNIESFNHLFAPSLKSISEIKTSCLSIQQNMISNKIERLDNIFADAFFVLGVFNEEEQDNYLKRQQKWLEEIQVNIEQKLGINLTETIEQIKSTDLLLKPTDSIIKKDTAFRFLDIHSQLSQQIGTFTTGVRTLDDTLQRISSIPEEKALSLKKQITNLLGISTLPLGNIISVFLIHSKISTFKPALTSQHSAYTNVKDNLSKKMQTFFYVNLAIMILAGSASFAVDSVKKPWLYGLAASYLAPSAGLLLKKKELDSL
jgi:hypothetical protein